MKTALSMLVVLTLISGRAAGVLLVDDDFEVDRYEDQDDFIAVWTPIGTQPPISGLLSTAQASSGEQSIENPSSGSGGRYHNELTFAPTPVLGIGDQLIWSFDFYDKLPEGLPNSNFASLQTTANPSASPAGQAIFMGLNPNQFQNDSGGNFFMASISGHSHPVDDPDGGPDEHANGTNSGAFFKLNDTGNGSRGGEGTPADWHNLKLIISTSDGSSAIHAYYVDGVLAETVSNAGPLLQYGVIRIGSALPNGLGAFYDNMRLEFAPAAVPEAGSFIAMSLVALLSAGAVWLRRRRAAL